MCRSWYSLSSLVFDAQRMVAHTRGIILGHTIVVSFFVVHVRDTPPWSAHSATSIASTHDSSLGSVEHERLVHWSFGVSMNIVDVSVWLSLRLRESIKWTFALAVRALRVGIHLSSVLLDA